MDSALRPRDIQARIRAGESLEDVARAAGVPVERVEVYASPVIAEREHVAGLAQIHPVRRRGETSSHRTLRNAVTDSLAQRGIEASAIRWDAWKLEDRRWQVAAVYQSGSRHHEALFLYEQTGRFSVPQNDEARWLVGDPTASNPPPGRRPGHRTGSGQVDDELAIVRALQSPASPASASEAVRPAPPVPPASPGSASDAEDAYLEGELTEVDGVYDIVPAQSSELDVLYDMLSSFDEDSVKIYSGLVHPDREDTGIIIDAPPHEIPREPVADETAPEAAGEPTHSDEPDDRRANDAPDMEGDLTAAENTIAIRPVVRRPAAAATASEEGEQLSLIDGATGPIPGAPRKPARRRRASVPSWDEIMFGSPHRDA